jgi:acetoin utilization protein AcuC
VSAATDLARALGWLDEANYRECRAASAADLGRFHDRDYVAAVIAAEAAQGIAPEDGRRFNIGSIEAPISPSMFTRPATAAGGALMAADLVAEAGIVFSPASGTHHGRRDRASGFCFFNDPVLGMLRLLNSGLERILYLDIDAHHGDGVEAAFADDDRVFTISIHEAERWPGTGLVDDRAGGMARNCPVPPGFNDSEMRYLLETAILPLAERYSPQAIMIQCGADALDEDPLSKLSLSNAAHRATVAAMMPLTDRLIVTGGGGYNPWAVARCWAGVWGVLNKFAMPDRLPAAAEEVLRDIEWQRAAGRNPPDHWFTTLADTPREGPGWGEIKEIARAVVA